MPLTDDEAEAFYLCGWRDAVRGDPFPKWALREVDDGGGKVRFVRVPLADLTVSQCHILQGYLDGKGAFECAVKSFRATRSAARSCVRSA